MSKTIPYIKLDWDWRDDEKVALLRERHGHKAEFAWIQMAIAMAACQGCVRLDEPDNMAIARRYLRTSEAKVRKYAGWFAECGLINADIYARTSHVTSARAAREHRAREGRSEFAKVIRGGGGNCGKPGIAQSSAIAKSGKAYGMVPLSEAVSEAIQ